MDTNEQIAADSAASNDSASNAGTQDPAAPSPTTDAAPAVPTAPAGTTSDQAATAEPAAPASATVGVEDEPTVDPTDGVPHVAVPAAHVTRIAELATEIRHYVGAGAHHLVAELERLAHEAKDAAIALTFGGEPSDPQD